MCQKEDVNRALCSALDREKRWNLTLCLPFTAWSDSYQLIALWERRGWGNHIVYSLDSRVLSPTCQQTTCSLEAAPRSQAVLQPQAQSSISAVILRWWGLLLAWKARPLITMPFTPEAPVCLNFSRGPHQTFLNSTTTSYSHLPCRHCGKLSSVFLNHNCSLFLGSQSNLVSNVSSQGGSLLYHSEIRRVAKWISFPMLACQEGRIPFTTKLLLWI
jgi:hypothetical protein